mgnify:CR=1 FL=1
MGRHFGFHGHENLQGVMQTPKKTLTLHHLTPSDLLAEKLIEKDVLKSYFTFTVIRDPFKRMLSDFYWQKAHDRHKVFSNLNFSGYLDVAEQTIKERNYYEKVHFDHFRPMIDYCQDDEVLGLDEILLLENIDDELRRFPKPLGIFELPKLNSSNGKLGPFETAYNIDRVYELYS